MSEMSQSFQVQKLLLPAEEHEKKLNYEAAEKLLPEACFVDPDADHINNHLEALQKEKLKSYEKPNKNCDERELIKSTNDFGSNSELSVDLIECMKSAQAVIKDIELDKAEILLKNSEDFCETIRKTIELKRKSAKQNDVMTKSNINSQSSHNEEPLIEGKEKVEEIVELAENAYIEGNLNDAEILFEKALTFDLTDVYIQDLLKKVKIAKENKETKETGISRDYIVREKEETNTFSGLKMPTHFVNIVHDARNSNFQIKIENAEEDNLNILDLNSTQRKLPSTDISTKDTETEKKDKKVKLKSTAELKFFESNFDKDQELLAKASSLNQIPQAKQFLETVKTARLEQSKSIDLQLKGRFDQPSTSRCLENRETAKFCIKKAQEAFEEKDYDKSERLLLKANRLCPAGVIQQFLDKVRCEKEKKEDAKTNLEQSHNTPKQTHNKEYFQDNRKEAKKCIEIAEKAYTDGDLDKAERFLKKGFRMDPADYVLDIMSKVKTAKEEKIQERMIEDEQNEKLTKEGAFNMTEDEKKKKFLDLALDSKERGNHYVAEKWLLKAIELYPEDELINSVLKEVQLLQSEIARVASWSTGQSCTEIIKDLKRKQLYNEANKYLKMAKDDIIQGDFENAKLWVTAADSFYPTDRSKQLLELIKSGQNNTEYFSRPVRAKNFEFVDPDVHHLNRTKAENYLRMARSAIEEKKLLQAEQYLLTSITCENNETARKMLAEVRKKIKKSNRICVIL